jgi:hypothetical protein
MPQAGTVALSDRGRDARSYRLAKRGNLCRFDGSWMWASAAGCIARPHWHRLMQQCPTRPTRDPPQPLRTAPTPGSPKIGPTRKAKSAHCPPSRLHRSTHPPPCKDSVRVSPASSQPRRGAWPRGRRPMPRENLRSWDLTVRAECLWRRATGGIVLQLARVATAANRNGLPMRARTPVRTGKCCQGG